MGRRGPAPTPTALLKLRGSWRGTANKGEPRPAADDPDAPAWLTPAAAEAWAQLLDMLRPTGVLTRVDGNALGRYCDAMVRWQKAAAYIDKNGETYVLKDAAGKPKCIMPVPQVAMYHKLGATLLRLEQDFGLTPSSRSRINVPSDDGRTAAPDKSEFFPRPAAG